MKKALSYFSFLFVLFSYSSLAAQESATAYNILKLPTSAHIMSLGGENVSLVDDRPDVGWSNPALFSSVSDNSLGLGWMSFGGGSQLMGAQYVKAFGERHTAAAMAQYLNYGSMTQTDESGRTLGKFTPKDIVLGLSYSYLLSTQFAGGATLKTITQSYNGYNSMALAVDLGLNYYDEDNDLSISMALRNIGMQVKDLYPGQSAKLPFVMAMGFSKGMAHLPVRIHLTATDLTRWKSSDYYRANPEKKLGFSKLLLNHLAVGVEILPTDWLYIDLGYNFRRGYELKAAEKAKGAGITAGAGVQIQHFKVSVAYAKYRVGNAGLQFNVAYNFGK